MAGRKEWDPRNPAAWDDPWQQMPRLMGEMRAVGLTIDQGNAIMASFGWTTEELSDFLYWADAVWSEQKGELFHGTKRQIRVAEGDIADLADALVEIWEVGLESKQWEFLEESMDLEKNQIEELFGLALHTAKRFTKHRREG